MKYNIIKSNFITKNIKYILKLIFMIILICFIFVNIIYIYLNIYNINFLFYLAIFRVIIFTLILHGLLYSINYKEKYIYNNRIIKFLIEKKNELKDDFLLLDDVLVPDFVKEKLKLLSYIKIFLQIFIAAYIIYNIIYNLSSTNLFSNNILINYPIKITLCLIFTIWIYESYIDYKYVVSKLNTLWDWKDLFSGWFNSSTKPSIYDKIDIIDKKVDVGFEKVDKDIVLLKYNVSDLSKASKPTILDKICLRNPRGAPIIRSFIFTGGTSVKLLMCLGGVCWIHGEYFPNAKTPCQSIGEVFTSKIGYPVVVEEKQLIEPVKRITHSIDLNKPIEISDRSLVHKQFTSVDKIIKK